MGFIIRTIPLIAFVLFKTFRTHGNMQLVPGDFLKLEDIINISFILEFAAIFASVVSLLPTLAYIHYLGALNGSDRD